MTLKVGDKVKVTSKSSGTFPSGFDYDHTFTVKCVSTETDTAFASVYLFEKGEVKYGGITCPCRKHSWRVRVNDLKKVADGAYFVMDSSLHELMSTYSWSSSWLDDSVIKETKTSLMEITREKVAMFFKGEPEKTFIEAGITDRAGELTSEGKSIFMNWLFENYKDDFYEEVVKPLADENKKGK